MVMLGWVTVVLVVVWVDYVEFRYTYAGVDYYYVGDWLCYVGVGLYCGWAWLCWRWIILKIIFMQTNTVYNQNNENINHNTCTKIITIFVNHNLISIWP